MCAVAEQTASSCDEEIETPTRPIPGPQRRTRARNESDQNPVEGTAERDTGIKSSAFEPSMHWPANRSHGYPSGENSAQKPNDNKQR